MNKAIIEYIPLFINYCKEKGLSERTQENYERFLNRFINWLKKNNLQNLKPHELSPDHICQYKVFLASNCPLRNNTQNYYLIALRALLSYFNEKDIVSLQAAKIGLLKDNKSTHLKQYLNSEQIKSLIEIPDIKNIIGLKNRIILELIIYSGLKINQILKLDVSNIKNLNFLPNETLSLVNRYLKEINYGKNKLLFVNYNNPKNGDNVFTARGIEKTISKYGKIVDLPFPITPEILRWSHHIELLNENINISFPFFHGNLKINKLNYSDIFRKIINKSDTTNATWALVEDSIKKEISWLKENISLLPDGYRKNPSFIQCDDCIFRKIAILLVSGTVQTVDIEVNKTISGDSLSTKKHFHGKEWHGKLLVELYNYFKKTGLKAEIEPIMNYGRADLGFCDKTDKRNVYIEIGTVSLYKIWYNLASMNNITLILVPSGNKILKFDKT